MENFATGQGNASHCIDLCLDYVRSVTFDNAKRAFALEFISSPIGVDIDNEVDDVRLALVLLHNARSAFQLACEAR